MMAILLNRLSLLRNVSETAAEIFGDRRLESCAIVWHYFHEPSRFDRIPACDRQTDRHTTHIPR